MRWPDVNHYFLRGCLSSVFISKKRMGDTDTVQLYQEDG